MTRFKNLDEARWRRLDALLEGALDLPPDARRAFLDTACGDDTGLRADLETLLAADRDSGAFLEQPAAHLAPELLDAVQEDRRVGAWGIVREIGRGGMGTVYLAERSDGAFQQQAALKTLRRGLDTDDILDRFRAERQILARLEHPNIARLLDGGADEDGTPYFVMEHVDGTRLTDRGLPLDASLRLFLQVCAAVEHAHRSLVLHRDLKPANILVTAEGRVKLLDFGVARLLSPEDGGASHTLAAERRLTPDYAAPEQIRGEPTTTATDVYGLGAVLYELIAGDRPFHRAGPLEQAILERDPAPPSEVLRKKGDRARANRVHGDLDRIVLKALRRDPAERYATAEALRTDLERWLAGEPVKATAPTLRYRAGKFLSRHRTGTIAAGLLFASIVGGLALALSQARIAARERDRAVREARKAEEVKDFLVGLFRAGDPYLAESFDTTLSVLRLVERGTVRVHQELESEPEVQAEMMDLLGAIQRDAGRFAAAESLVRASLSIRTAQYGPRHPELVASLNSLGVLHWAKGEHDAAESLLVEAVALQLKAGASRSPAMLELLTSLSVIQSAADRRAASESTSAEAIALAEALYPPDHPEIGIQLNNYGGLLQKQGRSREARVPLARALEIRTKALGPLHINTAITAELLANAITSLGELERADSLYQKALIARRRWLESGHPDLARPVDSMALLAVQLGQFERAESLHVEALAMRRAAYGPDHPQTQVSLNNLAVAYYVMFRLEQAASAFEEVHARWSRTLGPDHANTLTARNNLGAVRREQGRYEESQKILNEVLARRLELTGPSSPAVGVSRHNLAQLAFRRGRYAEAEREVRRAIEIREEAFGPETQPTAASREVLATVLREAERAEDSAAEYRAALAICRKLFTQPNPLTADVLVGYGRLLATNGKPGEAKPLLEEALSIRRMKYAKGDVRTGEALVALGDCLARLGEDAKAQALLAEGIPALRRRPGTPDPLIALVSSAQ